MGSAKIAVTAATPNALLYAVRRWVLHNTMDAMDEGVQSISIEPMTLQAGNAGTMEALLRIIRKSKNRKALSWVGGGLIVLATGIWVVVTYYFPADTRIGETKGMAIESQGGIASGRDTNVGGDVSFGSGADLRERPE